MDQKERIIEQAMHMFVSQGIKSVRMDDIAQQLGVSKRTLYELFGDKEGLLYLAMDRYFEKKRIERAAVCAHARNVLEAMFMVLGGVMDNAEVIQRLLNNLRKFYPAVHDKMTREEPPRPAGDAGKGDCRRAVRRHDQSRSGHFGALLHGFGHHRAQGPHSARGHDRARGVRADHQQFFPRHLHDQGAATSLPKPFTGCNSRREGAGTEISVRSVRPHK